MRIGCCASVEQSKILAEIGYDYIELPLARIMELSDSEFQLLKNDIASWKIKPEVCNIFFPSNLRLTGPSVDLEAVFNYVESALTRASQIGVDTIVFGSAGAKNVPVGFSKHEALKQLVALLKEWDSIAKRNRIIIAIEPLNKTESNFINSTKEALDLANQVGRDNIKLLIDFYHFSVGLEDLSIISEASSHLVHTHIARPLGRAYPIDMSEDDYERFFEKLNDIGFKGRMSVEGNTKDFEKDAALSLSLLKNLAHKIGFTG